MGDHVGTLGAEHYPASRERQCRSSSSQVAGSKPGFVAPARALAERSQLWCIAPTHKQKTNVSKTHKQKTVGNPARVRVPSSPAFNLKCCWTLPISRSVELRPELRVLSASRSVELPVSRARSASRSDVAVAAVAAVAVFFFRLYQTNSICLLFCSSGI